MGNCTSCGSYYIQENDDVCGFQDNVFCTLDANNIGAHLVGSVYSRQGAKGVNQDAAILYQGYGMKDGAFCGVFDGHGRNGHIVSKMVRSRLLSLLLNQKNTLEKLDTNEEGEDEVNVRKEACVSAFKAMDKEIKLLENVDCSLSGTTAVVILLQGEEIVIANLGDSRAVLGTVKDNGTITATQLTTDLKPGVPAEADRIKSSNGRVFALEKEPHIQRVWLPEKDSPGLAMSRAFGDFEMKEHGIIAIPDVSLCRLSSYDHFLVLATDGVWDVLSNEEVVSIVMSSKSEEAAAKAVVDGALAAWKWKFPSAKVDDCTALCLFLQPKEHNRSPQVTS